MTPETKARFDRVMFTITVVLWIAFVVWCYSLKHPVPSP